MIRIAKTSSNLKGTYQKTLKLVAASTIRCMEVLRERAEKNLEESQSEEVRSLRREVASLKRRLGSDVDCEKRKVMELIGESERYRKELNELRKELQELKKEKAGGLNKEKAPPLAPPAPEKKGVRSSARVRSSVRLEGKKATIQAIDNRMEIDEAEEDQEKVVLPPREEWPLALRPELGGKRKILEDRVVDLKVVDKQGRIVIQTKDKKKKEDRTEGPKTKTPPISVHATPRALANMIREIVAEELRRVVGAPSLTERDKNLRTGHEVRTERKETTGKVIDVPSLSDRESNSQSGQEVRAEKKNTMGKDRKKSGEGNKPTETDARSQDKPAETVAQAETWSTVVDRKAKKASKPTDEKAETTNGKDKKKVVDSKNTTTRRTPRTATVQILSRGDTPYAEIMKTAKERVNIEDIGIAGICPRKARIGAFLLEIPGGVEGTEKAKLLADKLKEALADKQDVVITRQEKMAELKGRDIEDSITREEIARHFAFEGGCDPAAISMGPLNPGPNDMRSI